MFVDYLRDKGCDFTTDGTKLVVQFDGTLSKEQRVFLKLHKQEIIKELQAANDDRKFRFCYRFEFSNGDRGTMLSEHHPNKAKKGIQDRFIGRELIHFELLN